MKQQDYIDMTVPVAGAMIAVALMITVAVLVALSYAVPASIRLIQWAWQTGWKP